MLIVRDPPACGNAVVRPLPGDLPESFEAPPHAVSSRATATADAARGRLRKRWSTAHSLLVRGHARTRAACAGRPACPGERFAVHSSKPDLLDNVLYTIGIIAQVATRTRGLGRQVVRARP